MYPLNRWNSFLRAILFVFIFVHILSTSCDAQVTFSRDWNPGKRSMDIPPDCRTNIKSATAICHMLVNEIRQLAGCEAKMENEAANVASVFAG